MRLPAVTGRVKDLPEPHPDLVQRPQLGQLTE
jgi:hypothetical protein